MPIKLAPFGKNFLLAWSDQDRLTRVVVMDRLGRFLNEPLAIPESFPRHDDLLALPDGSVGWLTTQEGASAIRLVQVAIK
jgi:hypothetical protein